MNSRRVFLIMIGCVGLLAVTGIAGTVYADLFLNRQAKVFLNLRLEDRLIEDQQTALLAADKEIEINSGLEKVAKSIVPQDKDQAKTIREISKIAEESNIKLKSITFDASALGQAAPKPATPDTDTTNKKDSPTAPATPATPPLTQVKPVDGIPGVYLLPITISPIDKQNISYQTLLNFLEKLEKNRRTAHVDKIIISPSEDGKSFTFTITLNVYVKP